MELSESLKSAIVSYFEGNLTQSQAEEILLWVNEDRKNMLYFRQIGETWHVTSQMNSFEFDAGEALKQIRLKMASGNKLNKKGREISIQVSHLYKVAAAAIILLAMGFALSMALKKAPRSNSALFVETSAPKGSRSFITLPDSTSVWLNAGTKLRYAFDYGTLHRNVYLEGEAYFSVSKNKKLPFKVYTSDISVTALGTSFNVKSYRDEGIIETTLEEGIVRIDELKGQSGSQSKPVILKPKQSAVFHKRAGELAVTDIKPAVKNQPTTPIQKLNALPVKVIDVPDTRPYTSWKDSRWIFKKEKLSSLVTKLERRYDVDIVFVDKSLEEYTFTGILLEESLEQVMDAIRYSAPIRYEINAKEVKLYEDKRNTHKYKGIMNQ